MEKTLAATYSFIDVAYLQQRASTKKYPLRILDAACGTGLLLERLSHLFPHAKLYGVDASEAMLEQAQQRLQKYPYVHLSQASLARGETAGLPFEPALFDLITCTNTLHYLKEPKVIMQGLGHLLGPGGQAVIEDYELRGFPFPWRAFEWVIKYYDPQHVRLYTLPEVRTWCEQVGFQVMDAHTFQVDLFFQGWVVRVES